MTVSFKIIAQEVLTASLWKNLRISETIGQPDRLSATLVAFMDGDAGPTANVVSLFANPESYLYAVVADGTEILFAGLIRTRTGEKATKGAIEWAISATGWQFLAAKRLVGVPDGYNWLIQEDGDPTRLPTPVCVDPNAIGYPTPGSVKLLWQAYWNYPAPIDLDTFVTDVVPVGADSSTSEVTWSGSDLDGATTDLAAAGSAAAVWWLAHDSPLSLWSDPHPAPKLALHWGLVVMPDPGDTGDDLLAGLPSADQPSVIAPYHIDNDNPDIVALDDPTAVPFTGQSILPMRISIPTIDQSQRDDAVYVRGATGFTEDVLPAPVGWPVPYQIGQVHEGGTGWVGTRGGIWGERYVDAPAAVSKRQRDAFGNASIAASSGVQWTLEITVVGWKGWHKGQAVMVTDADFGLAARWFLIRDVQRTQQDPSGDAPEFVLTVGDQLDPKLGWALREQRLKEQRKPIDPVTQFKPYFGDPIVAPGEQVPRTFQAANATGVEMRVKGLTARWHLVINGVEAEDPTDSSALFWLTDETTTTDEHGQVTANEHASASATIPDVGTVWVELVL